MPPKRQRTDIKIGTGEFVLNCEWEECKEIHNDMESFIKHMEQHLKSKSYLIEGRDDIYQCVWRDCGMQVVGALTDFHRHSYFHCFHIKIKNIGQLLIEKTKTQGCLLDTQSRNLIPELPERLQCGWKQCDTILDNPEVFYRHVDNHSLNFPDGRNIKNGCKCDWEGCELVTKDRYKLREHLRSHTQERIVGCPTCGGLFSSRTKFFDHLRRQDEQSLLCYQCSHCNKRFPTERLLRDHVRHHVNQYKCPFCDMTCPTPSSLKSHIRYRHTSEKPFKCDLCNHSTKTVADLRKHLESHNQEVPFRCHISDCDYTARCYSSLANHFKKTHQDIEVQKYACHVCKSVFTRGGSLTKHLKKNHNFKWPSGHSRFRYKEHEDGYLRLQTVRYESIQLSQQMNDEDSNSSSNKDAEQSEEMMDSESANYSEMVSMETENMAPDTVMNTEQDVVNNLYGENLSVEHGNNSMTGLPVEMQSIPVQAQTFTVNPQDIPIGSPCNIITIKPTGRMETAILENGQTVTLTNLESVGNLIQVESSNPGNDLGIPNEGTVPVRMEDDLRVLSVSIQGNEGEKQSYAIKCDGKEEDLRYNLEMLGDVALLVPEERSSPFLKLPCKTVTMATESSEQS